MEKGLTVQASRNGMGIFAAKNFSGGGILFEIRGALITCNEEDNLDEKTRANAFRFDKERYLSPTGGIGDFLNHSCSPNSSVTKINDKLFIMAAKNIPSGEEIVIDYSTILASDDVWEMQCNCGTKQCRKLIKKFISLPKAVRQKYVSLDMVPSYILE